MGYREAESSRWGIRAIVEAMLNTQLAVWKKKSIVQHCLTVGYSTWKVSEETGSPANTVQRILLLLGIKT